MDETIYTAKEVAGLLKVSEKTVGNPDWRRAVGLPAIRLGHGLRFRRSDVEKCLNGCREALEQQPPR